MKQIHILILLAGIFFSFIAVAGERSSKEGEDCQRYIGSCEYYLCREKNRPCAGDGYFIGFGYKYCTKIVKRLMPKVSAQAKAWLTETATCLQAQLDTVDDSNTCAEIKREAINGHSSCYEQAGFCSLKISDKMKLFKMISPSLGQKGVLAEGLQVARYCLNSH